MTEFGVGVPQLARDGQGRAELDAFLTTAETLGYHSAWVMDHPLHGAPSLEPLALLSYAAALTHSIRLGVATLLVPLRVPVQLAMSLASVDQLSEGRLTFGASLGDIRPYYPAYGLSTRARVERFEEALVLLDRLLTQRDVTFDGMFWQTDRLTVEPRPVQQPRPPIWIGSGPGQGLRRAAKMADGWIGAGSSTPREFRKQASQVLGHLKEADRDASSFSIAKRVYIAVTTDRDRAHARLRDWFGRFYQDPQLADRVVLLGDLRQCRDGLAELEDAGAKLLILNPVFDELDQIRLLQDVL